MHSRSPLLSNPNSDRADVLFSLGCELGCLDDAYHIAILSRRWTVSPTSLTRHESPATFCRNPDSFVPVSTLLKRTSAPSPTLIFLGYPPSTISENNSARNFNYSLASSLCNSYTGTRRHSRKSAPSSCVYGYRRVLYVYSLRNVIIFLISHFFI